MRLQLLAIGVPRVPGVGEAIAEYERRLRHYFDLEVLVLPSAGGSADPRSEEGSSILARRDGELELVALTREGKGMTSRRLARYLEESAVYGRPGIAFAVGGSDGLAAPVLEAARHRLSLSPMTLPHELARLVLVEQLYRAGTLIRGEPYHRGA